MPNKGKPAHLMYPNALEAEIEAECVAAEEAVESLRALVVEMHDRLMRRDDLIQGLVNALSRFLVLEEKFPWHYEDKAGDRVAQITHFNVAAWEILSAAKDDGFVAEVEGEVEE